MIRPTAPAMPATKPTQTRGREASDEASARRRAAGPGESGRGSGRRPPMRSEGEVTKVLVVATLREVLVGI